MPSPLVVAFAAAVPIASRTVAHPFLSSPLLPLQLPNHSHKSRRVNIRAAQTAPPRPPVAGTPSSPPPPPSTPPPNDSSLPSLIPYPVPSGSAGKFASLGTTADSIPALFDSLAEQPDLATRTALVDPHHGETVSFTYSEFCETTRVAAHGLLHLGLKHGDIVSFFSENSSRWGVIDQAIMRCGAAAAVRGVGAPVPELLYIHSDSTARALIVEDLSTLKRLVDGGLQPSAADFVLLLFGGAELAKEQLPDFTLHTYDDVLRLGAQNRPSEEPPLPRREDIATLLYTSGTTGNPKGVVLTHGNILAQLENISLGAFDPEPGEVFVSILPCWHVFERTAAYWCWSRGVQLVYSNKRYFRDDLAKYRPHILISVPRVFENLHATIIGKLRKAPAVRKGIFGFFMSISLAFVKARRRMLGLDLASPSTGIFSKALSAITVALLLPLYALGNLLVWRKLRGGLGGRLRICLSGGGSIAGYLEDFFECAKIDICVGYGLTETSPVLANRFGEHNVRGSTGRPLTNIELKIIDRETGEPVPQGEPGELYARGPSVFREYWRNAAATDKAFDDDGFFDTGDLAFLSHTGDIVISGRSKDLIVLSNGENIEPGPIEDAVLASSLVDQVMLVGQDERVIGALVVPQLDELEEAGVISSEERARLADVQKRASSWESGEQEKKELAKCEEEISSGGALLEALTAEIVRCNQERDNYSANDRVGPVRVVLSAFSVENGMMTQTLKVKKEAVARTYAAEIESMYRK